MIKGASPFQLLPLVVPCTVPSRCCTPIFQKVAAQIGFSTLLVNNDAGGAGDGALPLERALACFVGAVPHPEEWQVRLSRVWCFKVAAVGVELTLSSSLMFCVCVDLRQSLFVGCVLCLVQKGL